MSDATAELEPSLEALLRADAGVIASFGANPVMIFDLPPPASAAVGFPYIVLGDMHQLDQEYEGIDGGEAVANIHIWSRTQPRGFGEARTVAAAVKAAASNIAPSALPMAGYVLKDALPLDTVYLEDTDGLTVHAVVRIQYSYDPA